MKIISIYYVILLTLLPPVYWILLKNKLKKYFLAVLSIIIVTLFFPLSSLVMTLNVILIFFSLKYLKTYLKTVVILIPIILFIIYKIYSGYLLDSFKSTFILVGISFFTLKIIHFSIDYLNKQIHNIKFFNFLFYMYYFPVFTAGPIIRYEEFIENINSNDTPDFIFIKKGLRRITLGFIKKIIITLPFFTNYVYLINKGSINKPSEMWLALILYSLYIYWDFSSYSDIAIGTSMLVNYKVPENFKMPYLKKNISLFWQNWHITLTRWLQTYIFINLSKFSIRHMNKKFLIIGTGVSQILTMIICGFWHGSNLNFILWGAYHGLGLFVHSIWKNYGPVNFFKFKAKRKNNNYFFNIISILITFLFVTIGWSFFSAPVQIAFKNFLLLFGIK